MDSEPIPTGPFRAGDASTYGLTRRMLRGRRFLHLRRGVVMPAPSDGSNGLRDLVQAALLVLPPDTVVVGVTGLQLRRIEVGSETPLRLASRHPYRIRRAGLTVARVRVLPPTVRGDLPLATVEHCLLTATADLDLLHLVVAGDELLRRRLTTKKRFGEYLARRSGRGIRLARRALELMAERVDSPQETRLRLCLVLAGLPVPEVNLTLGTETYPIGRVDLVYQEFKLIIEYEGDQHRVDRTQWNIDIDRIEEFAAEGYLTVRITALRMRHPAAVVQRIFRELRNRGYAARSRSSPPIGSRSFPSSEQ